MYKKIIILIFLLLPCCIDGLSFAQSSILLKDSTSIVGKVVEYKNGEYIIETYYGKLIISDQKILSIQNLNEPSTSQKEVPQNQDSLKKEIVIEKSVNRDVKTDKLLSKKDHNKIVIDKTSYMVSSAFFSFFNVSKYIRHTSSYEELESNISSPRFPISSTAGSIINENKGISTFELISASISLGSLTSPSFINYKQSVYKTNRMIYYLRSLMLVSGTVCYIYGYNYSNKAFKALEDCVDAYAHNDNSQVVYANDATKYFGQASTYYLATAIIFGNLTLTYIFDLTELKKKYEVEKSGFSMGLNYNLYSNTIMPTLRFSF